MRVAPAAEPVLSTQPCSATRDALRFRRQSVSDELLPYYERELTFIRQMAGEFAEKYPKVAGRLLAARYV